MGDGIALVDDDVPSDAFMFDGIDTSRDPTFSVSELAKIFFGRSPHTVRVWERRGYLVLDGEIVAGGRTEAGARRYTLSDVEKMAHALSDHGVLSAAQLRNTLVVVQSIGRVWRYL